MEITNACVRNLTWTHLRIIMREATPEGRQWYMKEASEQMWSTRTLDRNVSTQYYGRMMASQRQQLELPLPAVEGEDPKEYIKNPVVAEFMWKPFISPNTLSHNTFLKTTNSKRYKFRTGENL